MKLLVILLLSITLVNAHGEEDLNKAEEIIKGNISCDQLTDEQLELIGDYYMEQMHPGEAHEAMDEMMGGEGSESLRQMHINMARSFYCGEQGAMSSGMMDMMMGRGMMGSSGMMNDRNTGYNSYGGVGKMMSNIGMWALSGFGMGFGFIFMLLFWGLIIWLIIWIVIQLTKPKKVKKTESVSE